MARQSARLHKWTCWLVAASERKAVCCVQPSVGARRCVYASPRTTEAGAVTFFARGALTPLSPSVEVSRSVRIRTPLATRRARPPCQSWRACMLCNARPHTHRPTQYSRSGHCRALHHHWCMHHHTAPDKRATERSQRVREGAKNFWKTISDYCSKPNIINKF